MKKLPKDYYLFELFTNSLQGKSWLEVGSDTPESSAKLSKLNKCRDFKVASHAPRAPHMVRFSKEDLSAWPDNSFDYVLFNWSIGMFSTEAILKEASRIAREGIIIQDFLLGELSPKVPGYTFYTDLQWREILNSFGQIHVEMQIPEQALELPMRRPPQVRLYVVQVADNRDTLRAAPHAESDEEKPWQFAELPPILEVLEHPATQELLAAVVPILQNSPGIETVHIEPLFPKLTFRPPVDADDFAMNIMASSEAPSCVSFPEKLIPAQPRTLEQLDEAAGPLDEQLLDMYKFHPPKEQGGVASFQTLTPEEAQAEYERIKNKPIEELTEYERFVGRTYRRSYRGEDMIGDDTPIEELEKEWKTRDAQTTKELIEETPPEGDVFVDGNPIPTKPPESAPKRNRRKK